MRLLEILTEAAKFEGYWTFEENNGIRHWKPVFTNSPPSDALFPFASIQNAPRKDTLVRSFQAFDILPGKKRKDLDPKQTQLFGALEDALKARSATDQISQQDFQALSDRAIQLLATKSGLSKQAPQRLFVTTPPSSSKIAEGFANDIENKLNIPKDQTFHGHFTKRDALDVIDEIESRTDIPMKDKDGVLARLYAYYGNRGDTTLKIKDLWNGHRKVLQKAGIDIMDMVRNIDLKSARIPYLLIVDDNVQSGSTADTVAKLFIKNTGITPGNVLSLAMFKYP